jgi:hypothetical protein
LQLLDRQGKCISTVNNATPDGGVEVTVAGIDVLQALGLSERDLQRPTFDLVQADKSTQLLSVGQLDVPVRYDSATTTMTVVFCPEIKGILISWTDCISLGILHADYPRSLFLTKPEVAVSSVAGGGASILHGPIPEHPTVEQLGQFRDAIIKEYRDVFDRK